MMQRRRGGLAAYVARRGTPCGCSRSTGGLAFMCFALHSQRFRSRRQENVFEPLLEHEEYLAMCRCVKPSATEEAAQPHRGYAHHQRVRAPVCPPNAPLSDKTGRSSFARL